MQTTLLEQTLLFLLCAIPTFTHFPLLSCLLACLIILTVAGLASYTEKGAVAMLIICADSLLTFVLPSLGMFLPLLGYHIAAPKLTKAQRICTLIFMGSSFITTFFHTPIYLFTFIVLLALLALWLSTQRNLCQTLTETLRKNRDTHTELQLLLEQKNADLIRTSHYEIETATLRERNRIAREIHDNVGHLLTRSILQIGALQTINKDTQVAPYYEQIKETLNQAMDAIRESVHNLHQTEPDLHQSISNFVRTISVPHISVNYKAGQIPSIIAGHFLAIIKEAVTNTIRHSNADHMSITLMEHPGFYQLTIEDNGTPSGYSLSSHNGIGIANMQERVLSLGGTMEIFTKHGFKIFITVVKNKGESQ